jgi:hypothetical protein
MHGNRRGLKIPLSSYATKAEELGQQICKVNRTGEKKIKNQNFIFSNVKETSTM